MIKVSTKVDSYFIGLLLQIFITVIIFMGYKDKNLNGINIIMLSINFFIIMTTYTGGMLIGLIITSITMFLYASYIFYANLTMNVEIMNISYLWMIVVPMTTITAGKLSENIMLLQRSNSKLTEQYKNLVTIDNKTGLGNIKLFYRELDREMSVFKRYKTPCSLMIIKLPYYKDIKQIVGEHDTSKIIKDISDLIISSTRNEDERYSLEDDTLAVIMPNTNQEDSQIVKNRIKQGINNLNIKLREEKKYVDVYTKIAVLECNNNIKNAIEYKALVEEELQYDV